MASTKQTRTDQDAASWQHDVIRVLKRFHILADRYRNRRKRFGLRFNLIASIYNQELAA